MRAVMLVFISGNKLNGISLSETLLYIKLSIIYIYIYICVCVCVCVYRCVCVCVWCVGAYVCVITIPSQMFVVRF